jgi:hypothetical protein
MKSSMAADDVEQLHISMPAKSHQFLDSPHVDDPSDTFSQQPVQQDNARMIRDLLGKACA